MLSPIELPSFLDAASPPEEIGAKLREIRLKIEAFQDRWSEHRVEQFVAADYEMVYQVLRWVTESQLLIGRRFLEWGCGFAAVSCLAAELGWSAYGVEAHGDLIPNAIQTTDWWQADVELFHGNFLPDDAADLAHDPTLPSLHHGGVSPYGHWEMELDDFALVYSYPWPGENEFHEDVFDRYAAVGALLLMFIGPNEMMLWRKING